MFEKYIKSSFAEHLLESGYVGNGCGTGRISQYLCKKLSDFFSVSVVDSWKIHDAEYSVSRRVKSAKHKENADTNLYRNLHKELGLDPNKEVDRNSRKMQFCKIVYAALTLKGDGAYWDNAPSTNVGYTEVIAIASLVGVVSKYFGG